MDEAYVNAGLKSKVVRYPRRMGLRVRGRGSYEHDKIPIITMVSRGREWRLSSNHQATQAPKIS